MNIEEYSREFIKQRALIASLYIVDESAELLTFKSYEDERVVLTGVSVAEARKLAENDGFFKAKYNVIRIIEHFQIELVLVESEIDECCYLKHFKSGFEHLILKESTDLDVINIWEEYCQSKRNNF
ncbi:hypothetical protein [Acinetobacter nosocomialis]|uniref:hypothetical protein n=1 Tax=Acinetobacter nosocomialis TaxID=106654 RepID=UPI001F3E2250|nr:hypothetical protein [Acinetobacter nosocomialis]MCE7534243.1 hypothetical protein [Acinetobacter nosocomialis]